MKKNFTKIIMATAACIALTAGTTLAQNGRFSVGAELALPMGSFGDNAGFGFGGSLRYEMPIGDNMGLTGTVGYIMFAKKTIDLGLFGKIEYSSSMIPIQAGFKYYFGEAQDGFYAMGELGVHMFHSKVSTPASTYVDPITGLSITIPGYESSGSKTNLSYAPGIGYHLANLDLGLRYQLFSYETSVTDPITGFTVSGTSTAGYLGVRIAYVFGEK